MRDLLVRYLLGELDVTERRGLEAELQKSPELQRELEYLRECLPSPESPDPPLAAPPMGLAERTVDRVSDSVAGIPYDEEAELRASANRALAASYAVEPALGLPSWSLADLTVAGGVLLAVSMLFLPALRQSRDMARRNDCANNLAALGRLLDQYSTNHAGYFPRVGPTENAGMFAIRLVGEGYVDADGLTRLLVCRSSPLGNEIAAGRVVLQIPDKQRILDATPTELVTLCRGTAGSYAYAIGYYKAGEYQERRNNHSPQAPVLADAPNTRLVDMQSPNHRGCGQNVLMEDGSVHYQRSCIRPERNGDNIFLNSEGRPAAAHEESDFVLIPSQGTPTGAIFAGRGL